MENFKKDDLWYQDYNWTIEKDSKKFKPLDVSVEELDKSDGMQVIDFANEYIKNRPILSDKQNFQKVETLLKKQELTIVTKISDIENFLDKNWNN